jgi:hypothetical protein
MSDIMFCPVLRFSLSTLFLPSSISLASSKLTADLNRVMMIMRIQMTQQLNNHIYVQLFSILGFLLTSYL